MRAWASAAGSATPTNIRCSPRAGSSAPTAATKQPAMSKTSPLQGARSTRLLPVLLDRLTDLHPENRNEALHERTMTKAVFRQCVLRDISFLLNTTNAESETDLSGADAV